MTWLYVMDRPFYPVVETYETFDEAEAAMKQTVGAGQWGFGERHYVAEVHAESHDDPEEPGWPL